MNKITIAGRVGQQPEIRALPDGTPVLSFSIADDQGRDKPTIWWNCSLFGNRAQALQLYVSKGGHVTVVGRVTQREYTDKSGQERRVYDVRVDDIALQGGKPGQVTGPDPHQAAQAPEASAPFGDVDDEIPFADPLASRALCLAM